MSATDALLQDILDQAKITNTNLAAMLQQAAKSGSGSGGGAGSAAAAASQVAGKFNILGNVIRTAGNIFSSTFGKLFEIGGAVFSSFSNLASKAFEGTAKLSDLFDAVSKVSSTIPVLGAVLTPVLGLFQKFVAYQEGLLSTYQDLTKSGATFSGNLIEMRVAAGKAYMTLDEFGSVVRNNSMLFASSIGGVNAGIKSFTAAQNVLMGPEGHFTKNLSGLGVTANEASEMMLTYMNMQGNMSRVNRMSSQELAASTSNLVQNLDAYSKLTGESREQMEKTLKEQAMDAQLKAFLSALDPKEAAAANQQLAVALQMGGKGLQDEVKIRLLTNGKITTAGTDAANALRASTQNASAKTADMLVAGVKVLASGNKKAALEIQEGAAQAMASGQQAMFNAMGGPGMAGVYAMHNTGLQMSNEQQKTYLRLQGETISAEEKAALALADQKKQLEGTAGALANAQLGLKILGNQLGTRFLTMLQPLEGPILRVGTLLMDSFGGVINFLTKKGGPMDKLGEVIQEYLVPAIDWTANWFKDTFTSLADSTSATDFFGKLFDRFAVVWNKISEVLGPPIKKFLEETAKPMIANVFKNMIDWFISALRKNSLIARLLFNETDTEKEEREKMEKDPLYEAILRQKQEEQKQLSPEFQTGVDYDSVKEEWRKEKARLETEAREQKESQENRRKAMEGYKPRRDTGSIGATGKVFENFGSGTEVELHGNEGVITPSQMSEIVVNAMNSQKDNQMAEQLNQLNNLTQQLIAVMRETAENTRKNVEATQNLNGNLFV